MTHKSIAEIVFVFQPAGLPTSVRYPGSCWAESQRQGHSPKIWEMNYEWWLILGELYESLCLQKPDHGGKSLSCGLPSEWCNALIQMSKLENYLQPEKYHTAIAEVIEILERISEAQKEFDIGVLGGVSVRAVDYQNVRSIVDFAESKSIFRQTIALVATKRVGYMGGAYFFRVRGHGDLLNAALVASVLHEIDPDSYTCLYDHSFENFSLLPHLRQAGNDSPLLRVFDCVIVDHETRDHLVMRAIENRSKGLIYRKPVESSFLRMSRKGDRDLPFSFPLLKTFAPFPVLTVRVSEKRCYWSRCTYCVQNNKYDDPRGPSRSELGDFIDVMKVFIAAGYDFFIFSDEALAPSLLSLMAKKMEVELPSVKWCGRAKIERAFTLELVRSLKTAGCFEILFGLETIDAEVQKLMDKFDPRIDEVETARVFAAFREAGVSLHINLIAGFPLDTLASTRRTVDFVKRHLSGVPSPTTLINKFVVFQDTPVALDPARFSIELQSTGGHDLPIFIPFKYLPNVRESDIDQKSINAFGKELIELEEWSSIADEKRGEICRVMLAGGPHGAFFKARATELM